MHKLPFHLKLKITCVFNAKKLLPNFVLLSHSLWKLMTVFTGAHKGFHCSLISLIKVQKHTLKKEKKSIYVIYICYVIYDININS